ncbi:hypothetical protein JCGZ_06438 [Jatropha curcas]|uniref:Uncharacterized protein n=1 Tax=Jatropha curcas TaxID=180498 RepID=A0A067KNT1_JATCU|nr:hypothetical protein JCGZ_06438 [Jatropha curcas]
MPPSPLPCNAGRLRIPSPRRSRSSVQWFAWRSWPRTQYPWTRRGLGHNTRGRGGTILCSAASTAAITSFYSFLFYPSFWTSTVFTSCTVTYGTSIYPSSRASRQIMRIIKLQLHKEGYTWDAVPQEKHFIWDEAITAMLKVAWEKLCADRYADFTYRMRRSGKKQQCVSQEIWESWQKAWEDPAFKRKREIFAQNRRSETGGDGAGPSRHTGGSISTIKTTRLLMSQLVIENYTTARERLVSSQAESEAQSRIDEVALYLEATGSEKKRKVYGIGSQASQFYSGSAFHASVASAGPQPEHSADEFIALRACVGEQERQIAELRAHVMRLSSQPGVGTSSSDLAPATDRNVSTSQ